MKLNDLILNTSPKFRTDKGTRHSYTDYYDTIFHEYRTKQINILEVGIYHGSSLYLWDNYFLHKDTKIVGLDIRDNIYTDLKNKYSNKVSYVTGKNYYIEENIPEEIKNTKWDIIIDDGSHELQHQLDFYSIYEKLLKEDGILIIEDIQSIENLNTITKTYPELTQIDLRKNKNRYDDLLAVLIKNKNE
tara:strand:+ start:599 stop:1165 length:567 start_codon:yes stop_codon:yes gene_type:complete